MKNTMSALSALLLGIGFVGVMQGPSAVSSPANDRYSLSLSGSSESAMVPGDTGMRVAAQEKKKTKSKKEIVPNDGQPRSKTPKNPTR